MRPPALLNQLADDAVLGAASRQSRSKALFDGEAFRKIFRETMNEMGAFVAAGSSLEQAAQAACRRYIQETSNASPHLRGCSEAEPS